jgi:arginase
MQITNRHASAMKTASIIGVPLELGASRRGARLGPQVMRTAGLAHQIQQLGYRVIDQGDIAIDLQPDEETGGPGHPKYVSAIRNVCLAIADAVEDALRQDSFPVILGGDHSMAIGVLAGVARVKGPQGIIWIDAHADLNTPDTSPSGNLHGMSMAAALGEMADIFPPPAFPTPAIDTNRSVFIGLRELDPAERQRIHDRGIPCFTMTDIDRWGMARAVERAIEVAGPTPLSVHVSFDIDSLDPALAPGTGTPVPGGITYREAHLAMELIAQSGIAHSLELAEVNPLLDEHNMTAKLATELICSALGKSIL